MKKYFKISLAIFALLFLVLSCNDEPYEVHTHSFVINTDNYSVGEDNKLYVDMKCSCGEVQKTLVENGHVATPENAQKVLDTYNTGVIYFTEGDYQELLEIRHSKKVSKAKDRNYNPVEDINTINESTPGIYNYYRDINDLTLIADDKAVFHKDLKAHVGHVYGDSAKGIIGFDSVREIELTDTNTSFYSYINIDGLKVINLNFVDGAKLYFHYSSLDSHAKNIEINSCEFIGIEENKENQAIKFNADTTEEIGYMFENIKINSCSIKDYYQGIYTQSVNGIEVLNTNISNTKHNAIAIQSGVVPFSGKVIIDNNTISNASDRAIRFGDGKDATITVSNNKISNAVDDGGEILKSQSLVACSHTFDGNTYDGDEIVDKSTDSSLLWILKSKDVVEEK